MRGVAVVLLVAGWGLVAGTPSPTAQTVASASSFNSNAAAAVAESVGPDGKRGMCSYSDGTGVQVEVKYVIRPNAEPEYVLGKGDQGQDPAEAYRACMEAYRKNQVNVQSSIQRFPFFPFMQYFDPFMFFPFGRSEGNFDEAAEPVQGALSPRIDSFVSRMEAQNRALQERNLELQENLRRLEHQNLDMQRRLMAQIAG